MWHCFVGRNFGAFFTHETNSHIYFYEGQAAVNLFKTMIAPSCKSTGAPRTLEAFHFESYSHHARHVSAR